MTTLSISGMTCEHCQKAVKQALESVPKTENVQVDLAAGRASVAGNADTQALLQAVINKGYSAQLA